MKISKIIYFLIPLALFMTACKNKDNLTAESSSFDDSEITYQLATNSDEALQAVEKRYPEYYQVSSKIDITEIKDLNDKIRSYEVLLYDGDRVSDCFMVAYKIAMDVKPCELGSYSSLHDYKEFWLPALTELNINVTAKKLVGTEHYVVLAVTTDKPLTKELNDADNLNPFFDIGAGTAYPIENHYILSRIPYFKADNFRGLVEN